MHFQHLLLFTFLHLAVASIVPATSYSSESQAIDFTHLNELLHELQVPISIPQQTKKVLGVNLKADFDSVILSKLEIGDISIKPNSIPSNSTSILQSYQAILNVDGLKALLDIDFSVAAGFIKASGKARAALLEGDARIVFVVNDTLSVAQKNGCFLHLPLEITFSDTTKGIDKFAKQIREMLSNTVSLTVQKMVCDKIIQSNNMLEKIPALSSLAKIFVRPETASSYNTTTPLLSEKQLWKGQLSGPTAKNVSSMLLPPCRPGEPSMVNDTNVCMELLDFRNTWAFTQVYDLISTYLSGNSALKTPPKINHLIEKLFNEKNATFDEWEIPHLTHFASDLFMGDTIISDRDKFTPQMGYNVSLNLFHGKNPFLMGSGNETLSIDLDRFEIEGLDSFSVFDPLQPDNSHPFTLQSAFALDAVRVRSIFSISTKEEKKEISIITGIRNLAFNSSMLLGINSPRIRSAMIGSFFEDPFECFSDFIMVSNITHLNVTLREFDRFDVFHEYGENESHEQVFFHRLFSAISVGAEIIKLFGNHALFPRLGNLANDFFAPKLTKKINEMIYNSKRIVRQNKLCLPPSGDERELVNFHTDKLVQSALGVLSDIIGANTEKINEKVIIPATKAQSGHAGELKFDGSLLSFSKENIVFKPPNTKDVRFALGNIAGSIKDLKFSGLNYVSKLILLQTNEEDGSSLQNEFHFGSSSKETNEGGGPLVGKATFDVDWLGGLWDVFLKNSLEAGLELSDVVLHFDFHMQVSKRRVKEMKLSQLANHFCWMSTLVNQGQRNVSGTLSNYENFYHSAKDTNPLHDSKNFAMWVEKMHVSFKSFGVLVNCHVSSNGDNTCFSPGFQELERNAKDRYKVDQIRGKINNLFRWVSHLFTSAHGNDFFTTVLAAAPQECRLETNQFPPGTQPPQPSGNKDHTTTPAPAKSPVTPSLFTRIIDIFDNYEMDIFWVMFILITSTLLAALYICLMRRRRRADIIIGGYHLYQLAREMEQEIEEEDDHIKVSIRNPNEVEHLVAVPMPAEYASNDTARLLAAPALFSHPCTPFYLRFGVPIWLVLNIVCFISGHISDGAHVIVRASVAGDEVVEELEVFTFSLGGSLKDMYNAEAYALVLLIGTFSGAWPYIKCCLMLYAWFAPPWVYSPKVRGQMLQWLDILGKWSLIDAYVLVLCMIAFRLRVFSPPSLLLIPEKFWDINTAVKPVWGFFAFLIATICSLIINHVIIIVHRNIITNDTTVLEKATRLEEKRLQESSLSDLLSTTSTIGNESDISEDDSSFLDGLAIVHPNDTQLLHVKQNNLPPCHPNSKIKDMNTPLVNQSKKQGNSESFFLSDKRRGSFQDQTSSPTSLRCASWRSDHSLNRSSLRRFSTTSISSLRSAREAIDSENGEHQKEAHSFFAAGTDDIITQQRNESCKKVAICDHLFDVEGKPFYISFQKNGQTIVLVSLVLCALLEFIGSFTSAFTIIVTGLAGLAEDAGHLNSSTQTFSLISGGFELMRQSSEQLNWGDTFSLYFVAIVYGMFSIIVPIAHILFLAVLWYCPMTLRRQKVLFFIVEVCSAWAALEVFIVSIIVSLLELAPVSGFMTDPIRQCKSGKEWLQMYMVPLGILDKVEAQCFVSQSNIEFGAYVLIGAAFLSTIVTQVVIRIAEAAIEARENRIKKRILHEELSLGCGRKLIEQFDELLLKYIATKVPKK
eukprot:g1253.t1